MPRTIAAAATAALVLCAGCVQQPIPSPLPQATPTWSCTPVTGGTPYPCYENQYQETSAQNALYEQAEAVYRKLNAEDERIYRAGGVKTPSPIIEETTTGEALKSTMENYKELASDGTRMVHGEFRIASTQRLVQSESGSVAALRVCLDISDVELQAPGHKSYRLGQDGVETAYFRRVENQLKISQVTSKWVESC